jgi:hypothetical protein
VELSTLKNSIKYLGDPGEHGRKILKWSLEKLDSTGRRWNRNSEKSEFAYSTNAGNLNKYPLLWNH